MSHSAITADLHAHRRQRLADQFAEPVLLIGNGDRARNLPMNKVPFRQDSTFLYFTGCATPDAAAILADGRCTLFLVPPTDDDPLWHGTVAGFDALRTRYGVDAVRSIDELPARVTRSMRTIAVGDEARNRQIGELLGVPLKFGEAPGDEGLIAAIIALRRAKEPAEIDEMRAAAAVTAEAHVACMRGTRPGGHERHLWALFEAILMMRDCTAGYGTILTQRGEILHSREHDGPLESGRLLLLDGGAERLASGYGADVTRTWPVSGRFDPRQRAAYEAVLAAQLAGIDAARVGTRYRRVHDVACGVLAQFLADEKLITVSAEAAVELGAHAVFYPHGTGHLIGLDVHDLENFGDRPAYPPGQGRPKPFGTRYLRLDLPLEAGWVVTIEPGFYVVPAILGDKALREQFRGVVDFDRAEDWLGFGGIRIEDDVLITAEGPDVLTGSIPKSVIALEEILGRGPTPEERLS